MKHEITVLKSDCGELVNRYDIAEEFNTYFGGCVAAATREGLVLSTRKYTDEVYGTATYNDCTWHCQELNSYTITESHHSLY